MTKQELALIKRAFLQVTTERLDKIHALPAAPFETSDAFNQKINNLIQEHKDHQRRISIRRSIAVALIAAIVLSLAACCVIYREEIKGFFVEKFDKQINLTSIDEADTFGIEEYSLSYIPENYTLSERTNYTNITQSIWNNGESRVVFIHANKNSNILSIDTEDASYMLKTLNNVQLHTVHKNEQFTIVWYVDDNLFSLRCSDDIPWDEIEKMILSLEIVE